MPDIYDPEWLLSYIEGEMSPKDAAALEAQLQRDPRLARLVEELRQDRRLLRSTPLEREPADLLERAMNYLERQLLLGGPEVIANLDRRESRTNVSRWLAVSGLAALIVLSAALLVVTLVDTENLHRIVTQSAPAPTSAAAPATPAMRSAEKLADKTIPDDAVAESAPPPPLEAASAEARAEEPAPAAARPMGLAETSAMASSPPAAEHQADAGMAMKAYSPTTAPSAPTAAANAPVVLGVFAAPTSQPTTQPATQPSTQPTTQPVADPTMRPTTQPATEPSF